MFVFKAAVVGAGTMGGQIAQTIAAAGFPVDPEGHQPGPRAGGLGRGAQSDRGPGRQAGQEGAHHRRARRRPDRGDPWADRGHHLLRALRRRRLRDRGRARAHGDQAGGVRRAGCRHARSRHPRLQHLLAVDRRDRGGNAAPRQGGRLPLLLSRFGDAACGDRRGRGDLAGNGHRGADLRPGDSQAADRLPGGARLRRQPHPDGRNV